MLCAFIQNIYLWTYRVFYFLKCRKVIGRFQHSLFYKTKCDGHRIKIPLDLSLTFWILISEIFSRTIRDRQSRVKVIGNIIVNKSCHTCYNRRWRAWSNILLFLISESAISRTTVAREFFAKEKLQETLWWTKVVKLVIVIGGFAGLRTWISRYSSVQKANL